jgi:hypothetical protein
VAAKAAVSKRERLRKRSPLQGGRRLRRPLQKTQLTHAGSAPRERTAGAGGGAERAGPKEQGAKGLALARALTFTHCEPAGLNKKEGRLLPVAQGACVQWGPPAAPVQAPEFLASEF